MMRTIQLVLVLATALLAGCASSGFNPAALASVRYGLSVADLKAITASSPLYRLDYIAGNDVFRYETHEAAGTAKYYGFLFRQGRLVGFRQLSEGDGYWPTLRRCTYFPPHRNLDVDQCLARFSSDFIAKADPLPDTKADVQDVAQANKETQRYDRDCCRSYVPVATVNRAGHCQPADTRAPVGD